MSNKLVDEWNEVFQFKITVGDLKKPKLNCAFLVEAFCCFLKAIHIDIENVKTKIANNDDRKFRIYLVKYIDHFVHVVCNKPNRFLYGDLIDPNTKKTSGILNLLVNYYLYFTMVKDEVVKKSNAAIDEHNRLMSQLNKMKVHNEEVKIQTINKERALQEYNKSILENKQLLEELKVKNGSLIEDITGVVQRFQSISAENIELDCQIDALNPLIVTEAELGDLMKNIKNIEDGISSFDTTAQKTLEENQSYLNEINRLIVDIEVLDSGPLSSIEQRNEKYREEVKKLNEIKKQIEGMKIKIEDITQQHKCCLNVLHGLQDQLLNKKDEYKTLVVNCKNKELTMESERKYLAVDNIELQKTIEAAENELKNLQTFQEFIIEKGSQVIQHIAQSSHK